MDVLTLFGLIIGLGSCLFVIERTGILSIFGTDQALWSAIMVFGGTFGATLIAVPWALMKQLPRALLRILFPRRRLTPERAIRTLVELCEKSKRQGLDSLLQEEAVLRDPFLGTGVRSVVDGLEPDLVRENLEKEIIFTRKRHLAVSGVFQTMATVAPIFGLLGTLIGVVAVLQHLEDPKSMAASLAVAVTTTFFGIFGTNFLFLPVARKLNAYSDEEILIKEVMIEGILSIQAGELPAILTRKLEAFLARRHRQRGR